MADKVEKVLVEVIQGTQMMMGGWSCDGCDVAGSCGSEVDIVAEVEKLAVDLKESFGDMVELKYVDADKEGLDNYPVMHKVLQMGYPYPITLFNGEPKFAGGVMAVEIKSSIKELLA